MKNTFFSFYTKIFKIKNYNGNGITKNGNVKIDEIVLSTSTGDINNLFSSSVMVC